MFDEADTVDLLLTKEPEAALINAASLANRLKRGLQALCDSTNQLSPEVCFQELELTLEVYQVLSDSLCPKAYWLRARSAVDAQASIDTRRVVLVTAFRSSRGPSAKAHTQSLLKRFYCKLYVPRAQSFSTLNIQLPSPSHRCRPCIASLFTGSFPVVSTTGSVADLPHVA